MKQVYRVWYSYQTENGQRGGGRVYLWATGKVQAMRVSLEKLHEAYPDRTFWIDSVTKEQTSE